MRGFVYILKSSKNGRYYIGSTNDIHRRLTQHIKGKVYSTRRLLPVELIFFQQFDDLITARRIERRLKRFKRRDVIEKIIKDGKIKDFGLVAQPVRAADS